MTKIILFDGECHFCNKSVQFIIKRDPKAVFKFASLESEIGRQLIKKYRVPKNVNSLILLDNNRYYSKSTAALKISKNLQGFWKYLYVFILIPKQVRDIVYQFVSKNRYKLFNKETACPIPTPEMKKRFLQ